MSECASPHPLLQECATLAAALSSTGQEAARLREAACAAERRAASGAADGAAARHAVAAATGDLHTLRAELSAAARAAEDADARILDAEGRARRAERDAAAAAARAAAATAAAAERGGEAADAAAASAESYARPSREATPREAWSTQSPPPRFGRVEAELASLDAEMDALQRSILSASAKLSVSTSPASSGRVDTEEEGMGQTAWP